MFYEDDPWYDEKCKWDYQAILREEHRDHVEETGYPAARKGAVIATREEIDKAGLERMLETGEAVLKK